MYTHYHVGCCFVPLFTCPPACLLLQVDSFEVFIEKKILLLDMNNGILKNPTEIMGLTTVFLAHLYHSVTENTHVDTHT